MEERKRESTYSRIDIYCRGIQVHRNFHPGCSMVSECSFQPNGKHNRKGQLFNLAEEGIK